MHSPCTYARLQALVMGIAWRAEALYMYMDSFLLAHIYEIAPATYISKYGDFCAKDNRQQWRFWGGGGSMVSMEPPIRTVSYTK